MPKIVRNVKQLRAKPAKKKPKKPRSPAILRTIMRSRKSMRK